MFINSADHAHALEAVGQILQAEGHSFAITVIGGAALVLSGVTDRATRDVDVLALGSPPEADRPRLEDPRGELPGPLRDACQLVADDLGLDPNWLNLGPALQWKQGLPPGFEDRVQWRHYYSLAVGIADRRDLIAFKLFATTDSSPKSVHYQDLLALKPSPEEISWAEDWVKTQDVSPSFHAMLGQVVRQAGQDLA